MNPAQESSPELPALEAGARIRAGALTSQELVTACLDRIERTDAARRGWAGVDRDAALDRAREMDTLRRQGLPLGALHGVPVAVDERFLTSGGAPDRTPDRTRDARPSSEPRAPAVPAVIERLLEAGAVVIGSSRTVETRLGQSVPALHPHDVRRAAGAPCGNAAAAVGACQVPLAITCEAQGGVMLSASYCGVFGFRPTRGVISRRGAATISPTVDQVGILGRTLEDVAFLADVLAGYDAADAASYLRPRPRMHEGVTSTPPVEPDFIWLDMAYDNRMSAASSAGFEELRESLGARVARFPAPAWFGALPAAHRIVVEHEAAVSWRLRNERSDAAPTPLAERGFAHGEERYRAALASMEQAQGYFSAFFHDFDAVVAPAGVGEAPLREPAVDDDPVFCAIWALCGLPTLCVPLLEGESGMPIGVQLVGSAHRDDRLLRTTRRLIGQLSGEMENSASDP